MIKNNSVPIYAITRLFQDVFLLTFSFTIIMSLVHATKIWNDRMSSTNCCTSMQILWYCGYIRTCSHSLPYHWPNSSDLSHKPINASSLSWKWIVLDLERYMRTKAPAACWSSKWKPCINNINICIISFFYVL